MHDSLKTREQLLEEVAALRARLEEPEETLSAIHSGQIDAFVVLEAAGEKVYTLATAELLRQLQVITDSLPVAVAYLDRERRYHFNSRLHESWFGRPRHEITGRSMVEVMGEAMYEVVREKVDAALNGNQVAFEQWLNFPGTGSRCIHFTLIPHVHAEKVQGFVAFVQDTSERRRAEEALRLLADSGKLLADSPGGEGMLADAARLVVPALAVPDGTWARRSPCACRCRCQRPRWSAPPRAPCSGRGATPPRPARCTSWWSRTMPTPRTRWRPCCRPSDIG